MQALVAVGYQPEQIAALWEKHGDSLFWLSQDEGLYQQLID
jgi:hypothetical protein